MAKSKEQKQRDALARLVASIATGHSTPFAKRQEYNRLKERLGEPGRMI